MDAVFFVGAMNTKPNIDNDFSTSDIRSMSFVLSCSCVRSSQYVLEIPAQLFLLFQSLKNQRFMIIIRGSNGTFSKDT